MIDRYYLPGPERARRVQTLFDRIARRYDLINDLQSFGLHRFWKRRLLKLADVHSGQKALDVCCGTGDIAEALARSGASVIGCDFSERMLSVATARNPHIRYIRADALNLPMGEERFDIVSIGYGLRNLADFQKGISELLRVLNPGGKLLILDFGKPSNRIWRAVYFGYLRMIVPVFGLTFCGDSAAYRYILESLQNYPAQEGVTAILKDLGCMKVKLENFFGGVMSIHVATKPRSLGERDDVSLIARDLVRK